MAHSILETALDSAAKTSLDNNNPMLFLNGLEAIHTNWHRRRFDARGMGFLIFHWNVIERFRRCKGPTTWNGGVKSFRPADFTKFGASYTVTTHAREGDLESVAAFSLEAERWHNDAHMAIGMEFGIENEMMDPAVNIYYREFWRLHYFINDRFVRELKKFDRAGAPPAKIRGIEENHHNDVHKI